MKYILYITVRNGQHKLKERVMKMSCAAITKKEKKEHSKKEKHKEKEKDKKHDKKNK
jgi:hypothetical protein